MAQDVEANKRPPGRAVAAFVVFFVLALGGTYVFYTTKFGGAGGLPGLATPAFHHQEQEQVLKVDGAIVEANESLRQQEQQQKQHQDNQQTPQPDHSNPATDNDRPSTAAGSSPLPEHSALTLPPPKSTHVFMEGQYSGQLYLRLDACPAHIFNVAEIQFFLRGMEHRPLPLPVVSSVSSGASYAGYDPSVLIDHDFGTYWHSDPTDTNPWMYINITGIYFDTVNITGRPDSCCLNRAYGARVSITTTRTAAAGTVLQTVNLTSVYMRQRLIHNMQGAVWVLPLAKLPPTVAPTSKPSVVRLWVPLTPVLSCHIDINFSSRPHFSFPPAYSAANYSAY